MNDPQNTNFLSSVVDFVTTPLSWFDSKVNKHIMKAVGILFVISAIFALPKKTKLRANWFTRLFTFVGAVYTVFLICFLFFEYDVFVPQGWKETSGDGNDDIVVGGPIVVPDVSSSSIPSSCGMGCQ